MSVRRQDPANALATFHITLLRGLPRNHDPAPSRRSLPPRPEPDDLSVAHAVRTSILRGKAYLRLPTSRQPLDRKEARLFEARVKDLSLEGFFPGKFLASSSWLVLSQILPQLVGDTTSSTPSY